MAYSQKILVVEGQTEAKSAVDSAKAKNAPFKDVHRDKAIIHTWLAWQDEPGLQLHQAVKFKCLDAQSKTAQPLVKWFRTLFGV